MWSPPIELSSIERRLVKRAKRGRNKFFVFLRNIRHRLLDQEFQAALEVTAVVRPIGKPRKEPSQLLLATLLQAYYKVSDEEAVELSVMDRRWQMVLDHFEEEPLFSHGTLYNFRQRLIAHDLDKTLVDRTVALAEECGGFGSRQLRLALDSSPLLGAGRVEDTFNLLARALLKVVDLAAKELGQDRESLLEEAGLLYIGKSSLKAALDLDWGQAEARSEALREVIGELDRWKSWLSSHDQLAAEEPPLREAMKTVERILDQDTEPDPEDPTRAARRIKKGVARDRQISISEPDMRHGRKSESNLFNGFKNHVLYDLDSQVIREIVVRPGNEADNEALKILERTLEDLLTNLEGKGTLYLDLGYAGPPQLIEWWRQGVSIVMRPASISRKRFSKDDFDFDFGRGLVTCPGGESKPLAFGKIVHFPEKACQSCELKDMCTKGKHRVLNVHVAEDFMEERRQRVKTSEGRAELRDRISVEHAIAHHVRSQGRRARYRGLRKNLFDGRRHAALVNLQAALRHQKQGFRRARIAA